MAPGVKGGTWKGNAARDRFMFLNKGFERLFSLSEGRILQFRTITAPVGTANVDEIV